MQIKGVIFDLDGTLVHTIEDLADSANTLFKRHGLPGYPVESFIQWIGDGAAKFIEHGIGSVIDKNQVQDYVLEFKEIYSQNLNKKSRLYGGIDTMLDVLIEKNIKISLLSNKPHQFTLDVAHNYLKKWPFDAILGQRDEVPRKPDPSSALEIAQKMEIDPAHILFIGDSAGDIRTAIAAGMIPVWVSWGYGSPEPDIKNLSIVIHEPAEIPALLPQQAKSEKSNI